LAKKEVIDGPGGGVAGVARAAAEGTSSNIVEKLEKVDTCDRMFELVTDASLPAVAPVVLASLLTDISCSSLR